jgi:hypothetical protein
VFNLSEIDVLVVEMKGPISRPFSKRSGSLGVCHVHTSSFDRLMQPSFLLARQQIRRSVPFRL